MTHSQSQSRAAGLKRILRKLLRDEAAASAVFFAVTIASTVGFVGLGAETGLWFSERRQYQTAADAGAIAGAWQMATQLTAGTTASLDTTSAGSAWKEAVQNGATDNAANITVTQLAGPTRARVVVTQPKSSLLAAVSLPSVTIVTAAEASVVSLGQPCVNALGTTGTVVSFQGNPTLNAPNCILTSNSTNSCSVSAGGTPSVTVKQIYTAGGECLNGTPSLNVPSTGVGTTADPFSSLPNPPVIPSGNCSAVPASGAIPVGKLCKTGNGNANTVGAVTLSGNTWTLNGTYYVVDGDFTIGANAVVTGTATIILTGTQNSKIGSVSISSNSTVTLSAPTTGTYSGVVFYQNANAPASNNGNGQHVNSFGGGGNTTIVGGIYFPAETVNWGGNASSACTVIVAKEVQFSGTSSLNTTGCANAGLALTDVYTVALSN